MIRSGIGYDIHRFAEGLKLILGGVEIAYARGLEGHSDADVLSHAIADALLGAIGAGDIGQHFPNTDESIRGISSMEILKRVGNLLNERNARVINVDATVIAEAPTEIVLLSVRRWRGRSRVLRHNSHPSCRLSCWRPFAPAEWLRG